MSLLKVCTTRKSKFFTIIYRRARSHTNSTTRSGGDSSVYNKLYVDSINRTTRLNETKEKHKLKQYTTLSNDSDDRVTFFVPKIDKKSKKMTSQKYKNHSNFHSAQELLYEHSKKQKLAKQQQDKFFEAESKNEIENRIKNNMLIKSRKILYNSFKHKFHFILKSEGKFNNNFISPFRNY